MSSLFTLSLLFLHIFAGKNKKTLLFTVVCERTQQNKSKIKIISQRQFVEVDAVHKGRCYKAQMMARRYFGSVRGQLDNDKLQVNTCLFCNNHGGRGLKNMTHRRQ